MVKCRSLPSNTILDPMYKLFLTVLLITNVATSYARPTIKDNNLDEFKTSIAAIKEGMNGEKLQGFEEALEFLFENIFMEITLKQATADAMQGKKIEPDLDKVVLEVAKILNGKSGNAILFIASDILEDQAKTIEESALKSITSANKLNEINIDKISYMISGKDINGQPKVWIKATITNNSNQAISKLSFNCSIKSPERRTPWVQEQVHHEIAGGIEPKETLTLEMEPNPFTWENNKDIRPGSEISATIIEALDHHGNVLWSLRHNTEDLSKLSKIKELNERAKKYRRLVANSP